MVDLTRTKTDEETEREAVTGDPQVDAFLKMTPAETAAWIDDNVTDLASAKRALKILFKILVYTAKAVLRLYRQT